MIEVDMNAVLSARLWWQHRGRVEEIRDQGIALTSTEQAEARLS
jgi:hypothetical protein